MQAATFTASSCIKAPEQYLAGVCWRAFGVFI
jgi:hypothetical protein